MRQSQVRYGFLCTYAATIFVKRTADFRFEISAPVDQNSTNPTVRECFVGFCALSSADYGYTEAPGFNPRLVSLCFPFFFFPSTAKQTIQLHSTGFTNQASIRQHPLRNFYQPQVNGLNRRNCSNNHIGHCPSPMTQIRSTSFDQATIGPQSIIFSYNGQMRSLVDCIRVIEESPTRSVFEVSYKGARAIAKCWISHEDEMDWSVTLSGSIFTEYILLTID